MQRLVQANSRFVSGRNTAVNAIHDNRFAVEQHLFGNDSKALEAYACQLGTTVDKLRYAHASFGQLSLDSPAPGTTLSVGDTVLHTSDGDTNAHHLPSDWYGDSSRAVRDIKAAMSDFLDGRSKLEQDIFQWTYQIYGHGEKSSAGRLADEYSVTSSRILQRRAELVTEFRHFLRDRQVHHHLERYSGLNGQVYVPISPDVTPQQAIAAALTDFAHRLAVSGDVLAYTVFVHNVNPFTDAPRATHTIIAEAFGVKPGQVRDLEHRLVIRAEDHLEQYDLPTNFYDFAG